MCLDSLARNASCNVVTLWEEVRYSTASCGSNIEPANPTARLLFIRLVLVCGGAMSTATSTGIADHVDIGQICLTALHVTRVYYHTVGVMPRGPL